MQNTTKRLMALGMSVMLLCGLLTVGALAAEGIEQPVGNGGGPGGRGGEMQQGGAQGTPPGSMSGNDQRGGGGGRDGMEIGLMGKIASLEDNTITMHMAETPEMPDMSQPDEGATPPEQPKQNAQVPNDNTELQSGEMPQMNLTFATETTAYTLADGATVRLGLGEAGTEGSISDLAVGDTVRLILDDAGAVTNLEKLNSVE